MIYFSFIYFTYSFYKIVRRFVFIISVGIYFPVMNVTGMLQSLLDDQALAIGTDDLYISSQDAVIAVASSITEYRYVMGMFCHLNEKKRFNKINVFFFQIFPSNLQKFVRH